jgi:hypothetical protein
MDLLFPPTAGRAFMPGLFLPFLDGSGKERLRSNPFIALPLTLLIARLAVVILAPAGLPGLVALRGSLSLLSTCSPRGCRPGMTAWTL